MTTISGNNYTYVGTDLANALGYLITRIPTANSSDTLPTATDIITAFVGSNVAANNGQSFTVSIFNNSAFTITLNTGVGVTFTGISSDTILPQATRTYTFLQTAVSTISCYIIGAAPTAPSTNTGITLNNNNILVGNTSNIATGVAMSGDASIVASGALTLATVNSNIGSFSSANITVNAKGLITAAANGTAAAGGSNTQIQFNNSGALAGSSSLTWNGSTLSTPQLTSTVTTGTAPLVVTSTTQVANLNVASSGTSTNINLTDDTASANNYLLFSNAPTGSQPLKTNASCRYNPDLTTGGIFILNSTAASSSTTGAIINSGGEGIAKNLWIGSNFTGANASIVGSVLNIPSFTYTTSTSNPTNVNIDTLNQITLNGTGTATNATSLYIAGPPVAGTLAITNPYAIQVATGNSNFQGAVNVTGTLTTDTISKISGTETLWSDSTTANIGSSATTGTTTVNIASSSNSNIQTSTMATWTAAAPDATKSWTGVCYGGGTFVAVSNSGVAAAGLVRTSTDGITWTSRTATSINTWSAVCFAPDINRFCAVASSGLGNTSAMFSDGGATWTQTTTLAAGTYSSVCRGTNVPGTLGNIFVTTNSSGATTTTQVYTSPDGVTWTARTVGSNANYNFSSCCWSDSLKLFVAVGTLAPAGAQIVTSPDGVTWTNRSSPSTQQWRSVCWSPELGLFVAVASNGTTTTQIMTSATGTTWANATSPSAQAWQSVCWSSSYKMFVAVANNGTVAQQIMYSATGTGTWTAATSTSAISWNSITFSDNVLNRFVAVSASVSAGNGMYTTVPTGYNNNLVIGSTGKSNISFNASNLVVYPVPYYYGENTIARTVVANTPLTDITIYNVPNGRYLVQIWMLNLLKTGAATTDFIIMTGSVQGIVYTFTNSPALSLVGSASAATASTGPKYFQFAINSYSSTGIQNISYQYQSSGGAAIFTTGVLRTMVLQRIG
jgi:hypothetical protein